MALLLHSGASSTDLGTPGTKRDDISDYLAACLMLAPNLAGSLRVGPEFADSIVQWDEDRLNNDYVTLLDSGGINNSATTFTVSQADAAVLYNGAILADISTTLGGIANGEYMQVTGISGTTVTITRAMFSTTAVAHAQNAVLSIVARPTYENSDLGADQSRARIKKYNYLHRQEINVNLSSEVIMRSRRGATPGIQDELEYQFYNRTEEIVRIWNKSLIYSKGGPGTTGTAAQSGGDFSTMHGLRAWLDGTANSTAATLDFTALGYGVGQLHLVTNLANKILYRNGVTPDWAVGGPNVAEAWGNVYQDRIRTQQDETTRGFIATFFRTSIANELRIMLDGYVQDGSPVADIFILDSARLRIRPLAEQFYYVITAPTLRDGDAIRALSKMSFEARNTGSDVGQAHYLIKNVSAV